MFSAPREWVDMQQENIDVALRLSTAALDAFGRLSTFQNEVSRTAWVECAAQLRAFVENDCRVEPSAVSSGAYEAHLNRLVDASGGVARIVLQMQAEMAQPVREYAQGCAESARQLLAVPSWNASGDGEIPAPGAHRGKRRVPR